VRDLAHRHFEPGQLSEVDSFWVLAPWFSEQRDAAEYSRLACRQRAALAWLDQTGPNEPCEPPWAPEPPALAHHPLD
jgi:hypothetical protein